MVAHVVGDRVREIDEVARVLGRALRGKGLQQLLPIDLQYRRELGGLGGGVGHERGVGVHGRPLDRHREVATVAVEHAAALRGQSDRVLGEVDGELLVLAPAGQLQLSDPCAERAEAEQQERAAYTQPARRAAPRAPPARPEAWPARPVALLVAVQVDGRVGARRCRRAVEAGAGSDRADRFRHG